MSVTKAQILSLVDWFTATLADQTSAGRIYDEVVRELGHDPRVWCAQVAVLNTGIVADTSNVERIELPTANLAAKLLAIFYNGRQLSEETRQCLRAADREWEDRVGQPIAFVREEESSGFVRLYPKASRVPLTGKTFAAYEDVPIMLFTDVSPTLPDLLALPVALLICSREFERESTHRDLPTSQIWQAIAADMLQQIF